MEASDLKRLKDLKGKNRRLNKMYADLSIDNALMKELMKKGCNPDSTPGLGHYLIEDHQASKQRASRCTGMSRSSLYYQPKPRDDGDVIDLLTKLVEKYLCYGVRQAVFQNTGTGASLGTISGCTGCIRG